MAKKKYSKRSPEEIKQQVEDLTTGMEKKVESYYESPEKMKEYLDFMGKLHNYSSRNSTLINSQFDGAKAVGSFKTWKEQGFSVNKGEKGIQILVPRISKLFKDTDDKWKSISKASDSDKEHRPTKEVVNYGIGHVFDVSQTSAKESDLPKILPNRHMDGKVENYQELYKAMEAVADKNGIKIVEPKQELGVAKGVSYTNLKEVALNPRNSEVQNTKTLLHELAHATMHRTDNHKEYSKSDKEMQAEMLAYTVSSYYGVDTERYSLKYLHSYKDGLSLVGKQRALEEVRTNAKSFITTMDEALDKNKEEGKEKPKEKQPVMDEKQKASVHSFSSNNITAEGFKNAFKLETLHYVQPDMAQTIEDPNTKDRVERSKNMMKFEQSASPEKANQLKQNAFEEIKGLPISANAVKKIEREETYTNKQLEMNQSAKEKNEKAPKKKKEASLEK